MEVVNNINKETKMAEKKTQPIVIDNVEYDFNDLTSEQQVIINHIADLERKISSAQFNLSQLAVGKDAFILMLKKSLEAPVELEKE